MADTTTESTAAPPAENAPAAGAPAASSPASADTGRDWLPEALRSDPTLANFKGPDDLVEAWKSAESTVGKRWEDLTPEQLDQVVRKRGVPAEAARYELKFEEAVAAQVDPAGLSRFQDAAHKAGLLPHQAQAMADLHLAVDQERGHAIAAETEKRADATSAALQKEWGATAPAELSNIARVLNADTGLRDALVESGLLLKDGSFTSPAMAQALAKLGQTSREPSLVQAGHAALTPEHAGKEIEKLHGHVAYYDPSHPEHDEVVGKVTALYKQVAAAKSVAS